MADEATPYLEQLRDYQFSLDEEPWRSTAKVLKARFEAFFPETLSGDYVATHFKRYVYTLTMLCRHLDKGIAPRSILEAGTGQPYSLQLGLSVLQPTAHLVVGEQGSRFPYRRSVAGADVPELALTAASFNIETEEWPFEAETFDVVILAEVIEHLPINPLHALREASRVLRTGGTLCVTTPNISCLDSVKAILGRASPHTFGVFQPHHGIYGHHNYEYVPQEIASLAEAAGFDTALLSTMDVYGWRSDLTETIQLLGERGLLKDRGHIIFYLGTKRVHDATSFPTTLYYSSP